MVKSSRKLLKFLKKKHLTQKVGDFKVFSNNINDFEKPSACLIDKTFYDDVSKKFATPKKLDISQNKEESQVESPSIKNGFFLSSSEDMSFISEISNTLNNI